MAPVTINGVLHQVRPLRQSDMAPGALVKARENRAVYRILCIDGSDVILRNVRKPSLVQAVPANDCVDYLYVAP